MENIPKLSFGCASFGNKNAYGKINQSQANLLVYDAIYKYNIRYFDTSQYYGNSEIILGNALDGINRDEYFIGTKVGRLDEITSFSAKFIKDSVLRSLTNLQLSYIDLVQLHDVEFGDINQIINEGLPQLQTLKEEGIIKNIGITGLHLDILDDIIEKYDGKIDAVLTYCNYGLNYDIEGNNKLSKNINKYITKWKQKGIFIIQGGFTSMGLFTNKKLPNWHPCDSKTRKTCNKVKKICEKYNKSITKVAFQYLFNMDDISTLLVGPNNIVELDNYSCWVQSAEFLNKDLINEITPLFKDFELWVE